jgi:hypothetical protein
MIGEDGVTNRSLRVQKAGRDQAADEHATFATSRSSTVSGPTWAL